MASKVYDRSHSKAYAEATRACIGILAAQTREERADALVLLTDYHSSCRNLGITHESSWAILFSATMQWLGTTVSELAAMHDATPEQLIQQLGAQAALWVSEESGRGGF